MNVTSRVGVDAVTVQPPELLQTLAGGSTTPAGTVSNRAESSSNQNVANAAVPAVASLLKPQGYVIAAAMTVGKKVGPFEAGTRVFIAATPPAAAVEKGDLAGAVRQSTMFISITLPGAKSAIIGTYNPSTQSVEWGKGKSQPVLNGNAIFFENARAGITGTTASGQMAVNAGVVIKIPGFEVLAKALASAVSGGARLLESDELIASVGGAAPGVAAEEAVRKIVADTLASGKLYAGVGYRGEVSSDGSLVTLKGPGGAKAGFSPEQLAAKSLSRFAWDTRNFGVDEIAAGKNRYLLEQGTSYEQLSPLSGGKNYDDPALLAINTINAWGRRCAILGSRVGNQTDVTDPSRPRFVKLWQSVRSGDDATRVVSELKRQLDPSTWQAFVAQLKPGTDRLGVNFGQPELSGRGPRTAADVASARTLLRDFHKDSNPQEFREIVSIPHTPGKSYPLP